MRPLAILSVVLLASASPGFAQVTVDLHALQALPDHPPSSRPAQPMASASVASSPRPSASRPSGQTPSTLANAPAASNQQAVPPAAPTAAPAQQPAMPESVPDVATLAPIAPTVPAPGSQPPPPPVSDKATTEAAPTTSGLRLTFAPGQADLSPESVTSIKQLTAATPPNDMTTFNVLAYAPGKADDPSTARRISLSRAMAVRSALVADGVPSARIFVRALGEQYGNGPADRVDLSVTGANAPADTANIQ